MAHLSFVAFALVYLAGVLAIFAPYRFFPSDDLFLQWPFLNYDLPVAWEQAIYSHQPVFKFILLASKLMMALAGQALSPSIFLVTSALACAVVMLSLMLAVHAMTRQVFISLLAGAAFGLSSWTATYFFFFSYGPVSSACCMASLALLLICRPQQMGKSATALLSIGAGLLMGLYFWSSPSAPVLAGLALLLPFFLWQGQPRQRLFAHAAFAAAEVSVVAALGVTALPALFEHVSENINGNWFALLEQANAGPYLEAERWTPFLTFFQVALKIHDPGFTVLFLGVLAFTLAACQRARKGGKAVEPAARAGIILAGYFVAAGFCIDLLPTTKLGRSLFQLYPIMLLATGLMVPGVLRNHDYPVCRTRFCLGALLLLCLAGLVSHGFKTHALYRTRFALPAYVREHLAGRPIYCLAEDIHAKWLTFSYQADFAIGALPLAELRAILASTPGEVDILVGPTEKNSALMSIYLEASNQDLFLADILAQLPALQTVEPVLLPFSAHHPAFLMENELTQALALLGLTPSWDSPASRLKLYRLRRGLDVSLPSPLTPAPDAAPMRRP